MQSAASDLKAWLGETAKDDLFVSVNLSSRQLMRQDLVADVRSVLSRTSLPPDNFRLELTESLVMSNPEQAASVLRRLRETGIGLSLDDFGTGFSSLSYLTRFPFDTLKIDRSFLETDSPQRIVLLRSIVNMARDLGLKVVAEGVAETQVAQDLADAGCDFVQSFLFGEPMEPQAALQAIKEQNPLVAA